MFKRFSLTRRIFTALVLFFLLMVGTMAFAMFFVVAKPVESSVLANVTKDMAIAGRDFDNWLSAKISTLQTLRHMVLRFKDDPKTMQLLLADATGADVDIPWIYYGTASRTGASHKAINPGHVQSGAGFYIDGSGWSPDSPFDWTTRPWFLQSLYNDDPVISAPYIDEGTGSMVLSISLACRDEAGSLSGVLAADVYLSRLSAIVSMRRFTPNSQTYLINKDGTFITKGVENSIYGYFASGSLFEKGSPVEKFHNVMTKSDHASGLLPAKSLYYAAAGIPNTAWFIVSIGPIGDVAGLIYDFYNALFLICGLVLLIGVILAVFEAQSIVKPIKALKKGAIALAGGELSYRVEIARNDEFGELASFFNNVAQNLHNDMEHIEEQRAQIERYSQSLEIKVARRTLALNEAYTRLRMRNEQMEEEVQMAAAVQRKIIPTEAELPSHPALSFGARYQAMANVGGDLYDVMDLGGGRYAFMIGDVSGHGIPAALIAAMAKVSFRSHSRSDRDPNDILADVNEEMCLLIGEDTYFLSAFLAILDIHDGIVRYSNAGHHPALLRHIDSRVEELDIPDGQLIGIAENFSCSCGTARMQRGDRLVLYTDGLIEARSENGVFYGSQRLLSFLEDHGAENPRSFAGALLDDLSAFCIGMKQSDDRALLVIGFNAEGQDGACSFSGPSSEVLDEACRLDRDGLVKDAAVLLEALRKRRPEDPVVMNALALIRLKIGDNAGAERLLRTAVSLSPNVPEYRTHLDEILQTKLD